MLLASKVLNCSHYFILTPQACLHMCFTPLKERGAFEGVTELTIGGKTEHYCRTDNRFVGVDWKGREKRQTYLCPHASA